MSRLIQFVKPKFLIISILILGMIIALINFYWLLPIISVRTFKVMGTSMVPTFKEGDHIFVSQLYYHKYNLKRGDLLLFKSQNGLGNEVIYIKRVIAISGDNLEIRGSKIYINSNEVKEKWVQNISSHDSRVFKLNIPKNKVFVIGDNMDSSRDSREIGPIDPKIIIGKVLNK